MRNWKENKNKNTSFTSVAYEYETSMNVPECLSLLFKIFSSNAYCVFSICIEEAHDHAADSTEYIWDSEWNTDEFALRRSWNGRLPKYIKFGKTEHEFITYFRNIFPLQNFKFEKFILHGEIESSKVTYVITPSQIRITIENDCTKKSSINSIINSRRAIGYC